MFTYPLPNPHPRLHPHAPRAHSAGTTAAAALGAPPLAAAHGPAPRAAAAAGARGAALAPAPAPRLPAAARGPRPGTVTAAPRAAAAAGGAGTAAILALTAEVAGTRARTGTGTARWVRQGCVKALLRFFCAIRGGEGREGKGSQRVCFCVRKQGLYFAAPAAGQERTDAVCVDVGAVLL